MCNTGMIEKLCSKCKCKKKKCFVFKMMKKINLRPTKIVETPEKNIMTKTRMILTERGERKEHVMEI